MKHYLVTCTDITTGTETQTPQKRVTHDFKLWITKVAYIVEKLVEEHCSR
jgi:hypothetical protein